MAGINVAYFEVITGGGIPHLPDHILSKGKLGKVGENQWESNYFAESIMPRIMPTGFWRIWHFDPLTTVMLSVTKSLMIESTFEFINKKKVL
jgi:hypothetical protein